MLYWILSFFRPRRRLIFKFWNGRRYQRVDPIEAIMALENHEEYRPDVHPVRLEAKGDEESMRIICRAVCEAFGVQPYDGVKQTGLTMAELLELFKRFHQYISTLR